MQVNEEAFAQLTERILHFTALDDCECNHEELRRKEQREENGSLKELGEHMLESEIDLRVGMLVVLLENLGIRRQLVNGRQGVIIGFETHDENTRVCPIRGEYADRMEGWIDEFVQQTQIKAWPVVLFTSGLKRTIYPICRINELGYTPPYSLISRTQIPLIPAWALTIHKSQGMTLDKVIVNLSRAFEEGQVYVALSRARSLSGLKVEALETQKFSGNAEVMEFLKEKFGVH